MKRLCIFIHVDADPDRSLTLRNKVAGPNERQADSLTWNGLPATLNYLERFADKLQGLGFNFKSTFFLRADEQIKSIYGSYSEVFQKFYDKIKQSFGVSWHPHLYRLSNINRRWYQEYQDDRWMQQVLTSCHEDLESNGFFPQFAKMGWCFHDNATMNTLSNLGVKADFSALPGTKCLGKLDGESFQDVNDWSRTQSQPYHPSEEDYQKAGGLDILEIPLSTYTVSGPLAFLYTTRLTLETYIRFRLRGYSPSYQITFALGLLNLSKERNLQKILEYMLQVKEKSYVTFYFHPDDMLDIETQNLLENVVFRMISHSEDHDLHVSFSDASELYNFLNNA